ncbi:hypothetical protein M3Y99_00804700 [Aphelenchoides fujianensis]|nr:hypothetical protein M3Y99_00804700 [Aphelenchoides fujianensis]
MTTGIAITAVKRRPADLREFTIHELFEATVDDWSAIAFAASVGLLPNSRTCERCKRKMHLVSRQENIDKKRWICKVSEGKKKKYCSTKSIRSGTFFEKSHLTVRTIVHVMYWWALDAPPTLIEPLCGVTAKTAADFNTFLRQECVKWYKGERESLDVEEEADGDQTATSSPSNTSGGSSGASRWAEAKRKRSSVELETSALLEKRFREDADGAVFARITTAIGKSFNIESML